MTLAAFDGDGEPVPVDLPSRRQPLDAAVLAARTLDRRPILPGWVRSRAEFVALLAWLGRYGAHATGFHLARTPLYLARLVARSPGGGWVFARSVFRWVLDAEQATIRADAVRRNAVSEYLA